MSRERNKDGVVKLQKCLLTSDIDLSAEKLKWSTIFCKASSGRYRIVDEPQRATVRLGFPTKVILSP